MRQFARALEPVRVHLAGRCVSHRFRRVRSHRASPLQYCDKVRKVILDRFDLNIDKFEMYVTKNIYHVDEALAPVTFDGASSSSSSGSSAAEDAAAIVVKAERKASGLSDELIAGEESADAALVEVLGQLAQASRRKARFAQESSALATQLALLERCDAKLAGSDTATAASGALAADFGRLSEQLGGVEALLQKVSDAATGLPAATARRGGGRAAGRPTPGGARAGSVAARIASQM